MYVTGGLLHPHWRSHFAYNWLKSVNKFSQASHFSKNVTTRQKGKISNICHKLLFSDYEVVFVQTLDSFKDKPPFVAMVALKIDIRDPDCEY
jgi:hypothetical protein